jgi:chemotaxis protein MotB
MNLRLNEFLKALVMFILLLSIVQVGDVRADLFGWDAYEECSDAKVATELKQKYCQRDFEDAEDRIQYVEAKFKETKIKLEGQIAKLESKLETVKAEKATLEKEFYEEKTRLGNAIVGLDSQIARLNQQIELAKHQMDQQKDNFLQQIADQDNTIQILKKDSGQREKDLIDENKALQKRYGDEIVKADAELETEKNNGLKALEKQRNKYERQLIVLRLQMEDGRKKQLAEMDLLKVEADLKTQELEKLLVLKNTQIFDLKQIIRDRNTEIAKLRKSRKIQKEEYERMQAQEKELANQLKSEIEKGEIRLKKFQGKLIINIDNRISFASGSASLKKEIEAAFNKISSILASYPGNQIHIEGHTDNVQLKVDAEFQDNWELSTGRALSVLRFILKNNDLDKKLFVAVGFGEFNPIANNETTEGRALNRRVDIVVMPKVDKVYN